MRFPGARANYDGTGMNRDENSSPAKRLVVPLAMNPRERRAMKNLTPLNGAQCFHLTDRIMLSLRARLYCATVCNQRLTAFLE
jgi:hypothetical protein